MDLFCYEGLTSACLIGTFSYHDSGYLATMSFNSR